MNVDEVISKYDVVKVPVTLGGIPDAEVGELILNRRIYRELNRSLASKHFSMDFVLKLIDDNWEIIGAEIIIREHSNVR